MRGLDRESRLEAADALRGKALPERDDKLLEAVCRAIYSWSTVNTDESWRDAWESATDAYSTAMGGGSSLLVQGKKIIELVRKGTP